MFEKFDRAIELGGICWNTLMLDKELLLFPIMSSLGLIVVMAGIFAPAFVFGDMMALQQNLQEDGPDLFQNPKVLAIMFLTYFCAYFVITFFNAGLLACSMIRFAGGDPTVMDGLRAATRNLPQILAWAFVCATIGVLIQFIASRFKSLSRIISGVLGAAWAAASYFAIPILVVEGVGPLTALSQSVGMLRKTWGESLIGTAGLAVLGTVAAWVTIPFAGTAGWLWAQGDMRTSITIGIGVAIWIMATSLVITTLSAIYKAALYVYAYDGKAPAGFDSAHLRNAFLHDDGKA